MGPTVEVAFEGEEIVAASWTDEQFVRPHPVLGCRKWWRSGERKWDWVFAARIDAAVGNGAEKRGMSGRDADRPYDPWS